MIERHKITARQPKAMRKFGLTMAAAIALIFGVVMPVVFHGKLHLTVWIISCLFASIAFIQPLLLGYVYVPWMAFTEILGYINSRVILLVLYCLVFVPMAKVMRLFGYDPMLRKLDKNAESYRIIRRSPRDPKHMERPY